MICQLEAIFAKLNINQTLITLKDEIKSTVITKDTITEDDFIKWFEQKKDALKQERKVVFQNDERIGDKNLSIETESIYLSTLWIQQTLDNQNKQYLTFEIDVFLKNPNSINQIENFLESKLGEKFDFILVECTENKIRNVELKNKILQLQSTNSIIIQKKLILIGIDQPNDSFTSIKHEKFNLNSSTSGIYI